MTPFAALLGVGLALAGPAPGTLAATPDSLVGPGEAVPYLTQGPLLCGGAAAAMLERFWGKHGVYAEDFAALVRPREGGIRTDDLADALERRGYHVEVHRGAPGILDATLADGVPVLLLIDGGAPSLHYVVAVGATPDEIVVHDPRIGPGRREARPDFMERWARADYWALVLRPGTDQDRPAPVRSAERAAEPASTEVARGLDQLRRGDYTAARATAHRILDGGSDPTLGWRILATARYLDGDAAGALAAWNRLGEPRIDLVRIRGLHRTRYPAVEADLGLRHGTLLTAKDLTRARRRLLDVPSLALARVSYEPLPDGTVVARADVLERSPWPHGPTAVATLAVQAASDRRAEVDVGPLVGDGDRWSLGATWDPAAQDAHLRVSSLAPPLPGVLGVELAWNRTRFLLDGSAGTGEPAVEERLGAGVRLTRWVTAGVRVEAGVGLDRWTDLGRLGRASAGVTLADPADRVRLRLTGEGWTGGPHPFGRASAELSARLPRGDVGGWRLDAGVGAASADAPRMLWWGAGTGRFGTALLRAHPLVHDDAVDGPALGRGMAHLTVERALLHRIGPLQVGPALFADGAHVWRAAGTGSASSWVDAGAGLRAELGDRILRLDLAHGIGGASAGGEGWVFSAGVTTLVP